MNTRLELLKGKNIVVYDCEIKNVVDGTNIKWTDYQKMGLAVACLFDYVSMDYKVYFENDIIELAKRLNEACMVVGFNIVQFDNSLIRGICAALKQEAELKSWDMLEWSRRATGWDPSKRFPSGMTLDNHLQATFGDSEMKTAHGSEAPKMYQEGRMGDLVSYCLADVKREKMLFEQIVDHGWVKTEAHGKKYIDLSVINQQLMVTTL